MNVQRTRRQTCGGMLSLLWLLVLTSAIGPLLVLRYSQQAEAAQRQRRQLAHVMADGVDTLSSALDSIKSDLHSAQALLDRRQRRKRSGGQRPWLGGQAFLDGKARKDKLVRQSAKRNDHRRPTSPPLRLPRNVTGSSARSEDVFDSEAVIFVMISTKDIHLKAFLRSMVRSDMPRAMPFVFSIDGHDEALETQVNLFKQTFPNAMLFHHPFACSLGHEHHSFPVYVDGQLYDDWKGFCAKSHWWYAANKVWKMFPRLKLMVYLEEDFVVAKNIFGSIQQLYLTAEDEDHLGFMLQCRRNLWTVSGGMLRRMWEQISASPSFFCGFDEYNWDLTVKQLLIRKASSSPSYICFADTDMAEHLGKIGKGLTQGVDYADRSELKRRISLKEKEFYTRSDSVGMDDGKWLDTRPMRLEQLSKRHNGYGGYGLPAYQQHCSIVWKFFQQVTPSEARLDHDYAWAMAQHGSGWAELQP